MADSLKISLAQINPVLGDIAGNAAKITEYRARAADAGADIIVFTEFSIAGYPPEDLIRKPIFADQCEAAIAKLTAVTADAGPAMVVGGPRRADGRLYNCLYFLSGGKIAATVDKQHLPNYGVFDEPRVFDAGTGQQPVEFRGINLGLSVCEDIWFPTVPAALTKAGADVIIAPHGSPYTMDKLDERLTIASQRVRETGLPLILINQVGGQDELVFDGASFVLNGDGGLAVMARSFSEDLIHTQWTKGKQGWQCTPIDAGDGFDEMEALYSALVLGLRDYVNKNGFPGVLVGLSGGVDSALTAAIAVDALGAKRVHSVMMPSRYTSQESLDDAIACAGALGIKHETIDIEPMVGAFSAALAPQFAGLAADTTEENIQARIRGILLMAMSNKLGHMVVATGNKSEMSVGYSTLYGDLCGGFAILKDVYKTKAYELCRWRNANIPQIGLDSPSGDVIPENTITKAPTAELREDQKDQDSLPEYADLDRILEALIEDDCSVEDVVSLGYDEQVVARVEHMLYIAEYKRRQAPPGVKVTSRHLGRDRRYPITNRFRNAARTKDDT